MAAIPRRTQADRTAAARAVLISAAVSLLVEKGFAKSTTAAITQEAGVTTGALHHHFPSKEDLFFAVLDSATEDIGRQFQELSETSDARDNTAATLVDSLWKVYGSRRYWAVWEINIGFRSQPEQYERLLVHRSRTREMMREIVIENAALSDLTKEVLLHLMPFILSSMRGIFLETFMQRNDDFVEAHLTILVDVFQRTLQSRQSALIAR